MFRLNKHTAMNPMGIEILNNWRRQQGPNVCRISCQSTENGRAQLDRNDLSDRYLQKFGSSVLSMVNHHGNDHKEDAAGEAAQALEFGE